MFVLAKRRLLSLFVALTCALLAACGADAPDPTGEPTVGGEKTFVFAQGPEPSSLDPGLITDAYSGFVVQNLFEGLLVWNAAGTELLPGAAERYTVSPDGRTYTFHLREGAIWSNGDPVAAADFVVAWRRMLNPSSSSPYAALLYPIRGARQLHQGEATDASLLAVEAHDRHTLVVELRAPSPWFPHIVAHFVCAPVNARSLKRHGTLWTRPENMVVNGPFVLERWTEGTELVLRKNRYFHGADSVRLDRVVGRLGSEPTEVLAAFEAGQLHWTGHAAGLLPHDRLAELAQRPEARLGAQLGTSWLALNTREAPLNSKVLRQALSLALDRKELAPLLGPEGLPGARLIPEGMSGYPYPPAPAYNLEKARTLLAASGYDPAAEGAALEIAVDRRTTHERVVAWAAETWKRDLGLDTRIFTRVYPVHATALREGQFQIGRGGWLGDYPDPANFLEIFQSGNALNAAGWSNRVFDGLLEEARRTQDASSRLRLLSQAEALLLDEAPILPLYHWATLSLVDPKVAGYEVNPLGVHLLKYMDLR